METTERRRIHHALKGIMFAQFVSLGCLHPVISTYLQNHLHFSPLTTGFILAGSTVAAFTTPLVAAFVADRILSGRTLFLLCNLMSVLATLGAGISTTPETFFVAWMVLAVFQGPLMGLLTTLTFHHLEDGTRQYGPVRLFGTLGWIASGWILSLSWVLIPLFFPGTGVTGGHPVIFALSAAGALVTTLLGLGLPGAPRIQTTPGPFLSALVPRESLQLLADPRMAVLAFLYIGAGLLDKFFYFGAAPSLPQAGFPEGAVAGLLTTGQIVEVAVLALLGRLITRVGHRRLLMAGLVLQAIRPLFLALPGPVAAMTGLALHGPIVGAVHMGILMEANRLCDNRSRSGINQIFNFLFAGLAGLAGNLGAGTLRNLTCGTGGATAPWAPYWLGTALAGAVFLVPGLVILGRKTPEIPVIPTE